MQANPKIYVNSNPMKRKLLSLLALFAAITAAASGQFTMNDRTFDVDTIFHANVGPGTTQTTIHFTGPATLHVYYATVDLTNPLIDIRSACGNDVNPGCENISSVAKRKSTDNEHYFAAINADFFATTGRVGEPVSNSIVNEEIFRLVNNGRTHFSFVNGVPDVANTVFSISITDGTNTKKISGINKALASSDMALYTNRYGSNTTIAAGVSEVTIKPADGVVKCGVNKFTVTSTPVTTGNSAIPAGECVLAGSGKYAEFVKGLSVGDELTMTVTITSNGTDLGTVFTQTGGLPVILNNGTICGSEVDTNLLLALHPRTAIGYNEDKTKLVMLVVDGRGASAGVNSNDLAALMQRAGCNQAMNLDGGGSSSIYIDKIGTRNKPSDGKERAVANGIYAVAHCPTDNVPVKIEFMAKKVTLPQYSYYTPVIYAYNKYGILIDADFKDYTLSCDASFATVTDDGQTIYCSGTGYKALTATFGDYSTSIPVTISDALPHFRLEQVVVDQFHDYLSELFSTIDGVNSPVNNNVMTWSSEDETIATVDATGLIKAVSNGTTTVHAKLNDIDITISVISQLPETRYISLFDNTDFTITKTAIASNAALTASEKGFDLDFTVSSTRGTYIGANFAEDVIAIPDSLRLSINPGTATISKIQMKVTSAGTNNTKYVTQTIPNDVTTDLLIPLSDLIDTSDRGSYPVKLNSLVFYLSNAASTTHKISVKSLYAVYTGIEPAGVENVVADGKDILINPNPVEKGQTVSIIGADENTEYELYNISGALLAKGAGNSLTAPAAAGVYVIRIGKESHKIIVK